MVRSMPVSSTVSMIVAYRLGMVMRSLAGSPPSRVVEPTTWPIFSPPPYKSSGATPAQCSRPPRAFTLGVRPISPQQTSRILSRNPRASTSSMNALTAWSNGVPT